MLTAGEHPRWCRFDLCEAHEQGAHIGAADEVKVEADDVVVRVHRAMYDAEDDSGEYPALDRVVLDVENTAFIGERLRAFLSVADVTQVVEALQASVVEATA